MNGITAVILAGGKNSRIGVNKCFLPVEDNYLIDKQINVLKEIFGRIIIVHNSPMIFERYPDYMHSIDEYNNIGPLGGIYTALKQCETEAIFVVACDMPNLNKEFIIREIMHFNNINCEGLVPIHRKGFEPLHAIYSKTCLVEMEKNIQLKDYKIQNIIQKLNFQYLKVSDKSIEIFFNINTKKDFLNYTLTKKKVQ